MSDKLKLLEADLITGILRLDEYRREFEGDRPARLLRDLFSVLEPSDFLLSHQPIWQALLSLYLDDQPLEERTVRPHLNHDARQALAWCLEFGMRVGYDTPRRARQLLEYRIRRQAYQEAQTAAVRAKEALDESLWAVL